MKKGQTRSRKAQAKVFPPPLPRSETDLFYAALLPGVLATQREMLAAETRRTLDCNAFYDALVPGALCSQREMQWREWAFGKSISDREDDRVAVSPLLQAVRDAAVIAKSKRRCLETHKALAEKAAIEERDAVVALGQAEEKLSGYLIEQSTTIPETKRPYSR